MMKNIKKYQLIILFLLLCFVAKGQQQETQPIVPPSPTIASLIQYADCPVSYYSGTPNIGIPLYEISVDNIKIPISLSYNASGIKVAQESSWVGLGWSLNAGGCISRSVQCYDDFLEYPYPGVDVEKGYYDDSDITNPASSEYYSYMYTDSGLKLQLVKDTEPDIFYYSFLGYSGKFILDKSRGAVLFDKSSGLQITVNKDSSLKKNFTVITPDGTRYVFNVKEHAYLHSRGGSLHSNNPNATKWDDTDASFLGLPVHYVSSWLLSKIITSNKREITFSYKTEKYESPAQESCVKYTFLSYSGNKTDCGKNTTFPYYSTNKAVYETYRLNRINWDNGYIEFNTSEREDMKQASNSPQKLENVRIYNQSGLLVKGYNFSYSYFNEEKTGTYDYVFKRLRLDKITDYFDANYKYAFNYFGGTFPAKNSKDTDYWGYCNGKSYGGNYYCKAYYGGSSYAGADKSSNLSYLKIGTLQSIQHPTGGMETFTYEEHSFTGSAIIGSNTPSGTTTQKTYNFDVYTIGRYDDCPGIPNDAQLTFTLSQQTDVYLSGYMESVVVSRDEHYDYEADIVRITRLDHPSKKMFAHRPSELYGDTEMTVKSIRVPLAAGTYVFDAFPPPPDTFAHWTLSYEDRTTPPAVPTPNIAKGGGLRIAQIEGGGKKRTFTYSGGLILVDLVTSYFETVTCTNSGSQTGHLQYFVQTSESISPLSSFRNGNYIGYDTVTETVIEEAIGNEKPSIIYSFYNNQEELIDDHPYMISFINFKNGLLKSIQYCKGKQVMKEEKYEYEATYSPEIKAFKYLSGDMTHHSYNYQVEWNTKKVQTTRIKSSLSSSNNFSINEEMYVYNEDLLLKSKKTKPYGQWVEKKIFYPTDYVDVISQGMVKSHYVAVPVEQISLLNGQVISGNKISYKDTLNMYLPAVEYKLDAKLPLPEASYRSAYRAQVYYDLYNKNGKLLQKRENGTPLVYLWSYKGEYPVAKISNVTYTVVASKLSALGTTVEELCEKVSLTNNDIVVLNALRAALPQSLVTIYTYKPLVGVESITSPDGQTIYYDYDTNGRLRESFYKEGVEKRVLQHYNYYYTNNYK